MDEAAVKGERVLKPANENPWYVLMTLYGEQDGDEESKNLREKNRAAWNAWSCQEMTADQLAKAAESSRVTIAELSAWPEMQGEIKRRHGAEMLRRSGREFSYRGLPKPADSIDMSGHLFVNRFVMRKTVFVGTLNVSDSKFCKAVHLDNSTFNRAALFTGTTLHGDSNFWPSTFHDLVDFSEATFFEDARFHSAHFGGKVKFRANFKKDAIFGSTKFLETADYVFAKFFSSADFSDAEFDKAASLNSAIFYTHARFDRANFGGLVEFVNAEFGAALEDQVASFTDCQFQRPTNLRGTIFNSRYPDFSGAILHEKTTFSDEPANWPRGPQSDAAQAKASCAVIRQAVGKQGLPEAEHFFFRREMVFAGEDGNGWQKLPYRAFGLISDYGHSIQRPFVWLVGLWAIGSFVFFLSFRDCYCIEDLSSAPLAMSLSFSNILNFFGFQRSYIDPDVIKSLGSLLHLFSAMQTVFGFVLLFFLGLGLRTRFRMR